ncbi:hypothetical protein QYE76_058763 [Lolium multiflorum]|uniref:Uncharacterized protein n=1 Tax=Lolium multiflorum TaxID=4521 RepID=A0AAD8T747_LOLMU|nr:hypothetical protein QYE76_058763 [Lolium multiflorum]
MENYYLLMGDNSADEDGGGVDGEAFRGHFPVPAACRNRDSCPPDLGFAMAAGRFLVPWLFRIETTESQREFHLHVTEMVLDFFKNALHFLGVFDQRLDPIYATVDAVVEFAEEFTRLEAENSQLRKTIRSSADQEEVKKLKQRLRDELDAKNAAAAAIDKKEGALRESIKDLLDAADLTVTRRHQLREDSTADALSLATESNVQVLSLLKKAKGALSRLYSMIFPKMKEDKTLDEMAASFLVDPSEPVEVLKHRSRLFGAVLTFQLLMGHGMGSDLEELSKALPMTP